MNSGAAVRTATANGGRIASRSRPPVAKTHDHVNDRLRPGLGRALSAVFRGHHGKTVNHRFLEASVRLHEYLWSWSRCCWAIASETFSRGKLDLAVQFNGLRSRSTTSGSISRSQCRRPTIKSIAEELGYRHTFSGSDLLRVPIFCRSSL